MYNYNGVVPELYVNEFQLSVDDLKKDKTLMALVYAVTNGFPLHDLTRDYKMKVKSFLGNKETIIYWCQNVGGLLKKIYILLFSLCFILK